MNSAIGTKPFGTAEVQVARETMQLDVSSDLDGPAALEPDVSSEPKAPITARVFVAAENRLLRQALGRMLSKRGSIEVTGSRGAEAFQGKELLEGQVDVLLLISSGNLEQDLEIVRSAHSAAPVVRILMIGTTREDGEFLQCVRASISGFLWREASADDVVAAIRAVPCAGVQQRLGFTRREQQLIPFIAKGLTNKEIANHFCLSEQTVKNHLYRMKHKIGADDRLSIVQRYRTQGFLL